jgi:hypothetical protein
VNRPPIWTIVRSSAVTPPDGSSCESAYLVRVSRGSTTRDVVVEFADATAVLSNGYAEEVTRRFLSDEEPPRHLVVEISKDVRVVTGPREASDDPYGAPSNGSAGRRARTRRRGQG